MRVLILCQGQGERWGDYLGGPKQLTALVPSHDHPDVLVPTVHRLVGQVLSADPGADVIVVAPDDRYVVPGARLVTLEDPDPLKCDMSKFGGTRGLWAAHERTLILWGDTYLEDGLVQDMVGHEGGYHVWRRPGPSSVTGHAWDESFGVSFRPEDHEAVMAAAHRVVKAWRAGMFQRGTHVRCHLAAMAGAEGRAMDNVRRTAQLGLQSHVDGWSDDFDTPTEWANWAGRFYAHRYPATVVIPWEDTGCPWRKESLAFTLDHWSRVGVPVVLGGDTSGGPWVNRAAARNEGLRGALEYAPEVVFLADADTIVPAHQFWAAVHLAAVRGQAVLAFTEYHRLPSGATRAAHRRPDASALWDRQGGRTYAHHISGAMAVPWGLLAHVGGYDERFRSWGAEDRAFHAALTTLGGEAPRIPGTAWHLHHPASPERHERHPNRPQVLALGLRYKEAAGIGAGHGMWREKGRPEPEGPDPDAMRAILAEEGGPWATWPLARPEAPPPGTLRLGPAQAPYSHGLGPTGTVTSTASRRGRDGFVLFRGPDRQRWVRGSSGTAQRLRLEGWEEVSHG